jgi:hypothetical protein
MQQCPPRSLRARCRGAPRHDSCRCVRRAGNGGLSPGLHRIWLVHARCSVNATEPPEVSTRTVPGGVVRQWFMKLIPRSHPTPTPSASRVEEPACNAGDEARAGGSTPPHPIQRYHATARSAGRFTRSPWRGGPWLKQHASRVARERRPARRLSALRPR